MGGRPEAKTTDPKGITAAEVAGQLVLPATVVWARLANRSTVRELAKLVSTAPLLVSATASRLKLLAANLVNRRS